jgi:hypothetical protein
MEPDQDQISLITNILLSSTRSLDLQTGTKKLLYLFKHQRLTPTSDLVIELGKKLLSDSNPSLRILGLKVVRKM